MQVDKTGLRHLFGLTDSQFWVAPEAPSMYVPPGMSTTPSAGPPPAEELLPA